MWWWSSVNVVITGDKLSGIPNINLYCANVQQLEHTVTRKNQKKNPQRHKYQQTQYL